jgi:hypothetical protein
MNRHRPNPQHNPQPEAGNEREHVINMLSAYIDGELDPRQMQRVDAHLESCSMCHTEYAELRAVRQMLFNLPAVPPTRAFTLTPEMVKARSKPTLLRRLFGSGGRLYPALATGSVVAFVLLVVLTLADTGTGTGAGSPSGLAGRSLATGPQPQYQTAATPAAGATQLTEEGGSAMGITATGQSAESTPVPATTTTTGTLAAPTASDQAGKESRSLEPHPLFSTQPSPPPPQVESGTPSPGVVLRVLLVMAGIALALGALAAKQRGL